MNGLSHSLTSVRWSEEIEALPLSFGLNLALHTGRIQSIGDLIRSTIRSKTSAQLSLHPEPILA
jgi:hypothetical protein